MKKRIQHLIGWGLLVAVFVGTPSALYADRNDWRDRGRHHGWRDRHHRYDWNHYYRDRVYYRDDWRPTYRVRTRTYVVPDVRYRTYYVKPWYDNNDWRGDYDWYRD